MGPRTYAAQVKEAINGNHFLVLTEGKRDDKTGEVRKTRLLVFGEDFPSFFRMLHETAQFIRANPVSKEVKAKRQRYWERRAKRGHDDAAPGHYRGRAVPAQSVPPAAEGVKGARGARGPARTRGTSTRKSAPR